MCLTALHHAALPEIQLRASVADGGPVDGGISLLVSHILRYEEQGGEQETPEES